MVELAFDRALRMLHLGANARLSTLQRIKQLVDLVALYQLLSLAGHRSRVPPRAPESLSHLLALGSSSEAQAAQGISFTAAVQQLVGADDVMLLDPRGGERMYKARIGVQADVRVLCGVAAFVPASPCAEPSCGRPSPSARHAKVPLAVFFGLVYLRLVCAGVPLGAAGCRDDRGDHLGVRLGHETAPGQHLDDRLKEASCQVVALQQMPKAQDTDSDGNVVYATQTGKLPIHRPIKERFFHHSVTEPEPLLQDINVQRGFDGKGRPVGSGPRCEQLNEYQQLGSRHHLSHLIPKQGFVSENVIQVQTKVLLFDLHRTISPATPDQDEVGVRSCIFFLELNS